MIFTIGTFPAEQKWSYEIGSVVGPYVFLELDHCFFLNCGILLENHIELCVIVLDFLENHIELCVKKCFAPKMGKMGQK